MLKNNTKLPNLRIARLCEEKNLFVSFVCIIVSTRAQLHMLTINRSEVLSASIVIRLVKNVPQFIAKVELYRTRHFVS